MDIKIKGLCGWWMLALLSVSNLVAQDGDLRLVDAAKAGAQETVRALLNKGIDVNITRHRTPRIADELVTLLDEHLPKFFSVALVQLDPCP